MTRKRFRFLDKIADGDYGTIYRAEQITDGQPEIVALKWLRAAWPSGTRLADARAQLLSLRQLAHPNIAETFDLVCIDDKCAIVREYVDGVDLLWVYTVSKHRQRELPHAVLFEIIGAAAAALDGAHAKIPQPAIHGDLKASNLFLRADGAVKVLDFALEAIYGYPGLLDVGPPEWLLGEGPSPAGDVFMLGVILYEMLALEDFGRIDPRPRKFQEKLEVRLAKVLPHEDHAHRLLVRDTLRRMLSYDLIDRPSAREVAVILDQLAREARKTDPSSASALVAWAAAAMPPADGDDPLRGIIIDSDGALYVTPSDHAPLLANIVSAPRDDTVRLVYADWLEERQDGRAALVRAQVRGKLPRFDTGLKLDPAWLARIDRSRIEGCRRAECPGQWEQLIAGDDPLVRSCSLCLRDVHHCTTHSEANVWRECDELFVRSAFAAISEPDPLHPLPRGQMREHNPPSGAWLQPRRRLPTPLDPSPQASHPAPTAPLSSTAAGPWRWWRLWR